MAGPGGGNWGPGPPPSTGGGGGGSGTITGVTAGTGLTGGGTTGSVTVALATPVAVANGGTGVITSTGSGSNVLSNAPALVNPTATTPAIGDNSGNVATTGFVKEQGYLATGLVPTGRASGSWAGGTGLHSTSSAMSTAVCYLAPLPMLTACTIQALGCCVMAAAAGSIQLGIYQDNGFGVPNLNGGPIGHTGDISVAATGLVNGPITTLLNGVAGTSFSVVPFLYWAGIMVSIAGVTVTGLAVSPMSLFMSLAGGAQQSWLQTSAGIPITGWNITGQSYGTWPSAQASLPAAPTASTVPPLMHYQIL